MNRKRKSLLPFPAFSAPSGVPCGQKPGDSLQGSGLNIRRKGGLRVEKRLLNNQHDVFHVSLPLFIQFLQP